MVGWAGGRFTTFTLPWGAAVLLASGSGIGGGEAGRVVAPTPLPGLALEFTGGDPVIVDGRAAVAAWAAFGLGGETGRGTPPAAPALQLQEPLTAESAAANVEAVACATATATVDVFTAAAPPECYRAELDATDSHRGHLFAARAQW